MTNEELLRKITVKAPTFNILINAIKDFEDRKEIKDIWLDVYRYFIQDNEYSYISKKVISGLNYTNQVSKVEEEKIKKLYQNSL